MEGLLKQQQLSNFINTQSCEQFQMMSDENVLRTCNVSHIQEQLNATTKYQVVLAILSFKAISSIINAENDIPFDFYALVKNGKIAVNFQFCTICSTNNFVFYRT